ncbi:7349_t:CDS:2, partial [Dentiscutata erythropus]
VYSGENIANKLYEILNNFGILNKILEITTDNASNNNTMFRYFANRYAYNEINFNTDNQRDLLKNLKAEGPNENEILLDENIISTVKKDFEKATINISGCKYSTIGLVVPYYYDLLDALESSLIDCSNLIIEEAIKKAQTKLKKYYLDANGLKSEYQPTQIPGTENISNKNVPTTSVSAKRVFSAAKELITSKRSNLNPTTIRACMCLKEWQKINNS